jgi:cardiolipin synthase C
MVPTRIAISLVIALALVAIVGGETSFAMPARKAAGRVRPANDRPRPPVRRASRVPLRRRASAVEPALRPRTPVASGRLLATPLASGSARLDVIRSAEHDVFMSTYGLDDDPAGRATISELCRAARSGKRVRLLLDALGSRRLPTEALAHLLDAGVEVALYNEPRWLRPWRMTYRMHGKLLVADQARLVLGGRNTTNNYFGLRRRGTRQIDIDLYAEGKVAADAERDGAALWNSKHVRQLDRRHLRIAHGRVAAYGRLLDETGSAHRPLARLRNAWLKQPAAALDNVELVHSGFATLRNEDRAVERRLIRMIDEARVEVEMQNQYLVPTDALLAAIARARARGVRVRIMTNSTRTSWGGPQWAYEASLGRIARSGAEVWELQGTDMLHAKTVVVDRTRVFISSYNLDPRSRDLNKELGIVADSPELARSLLDNGRALRGKSSRAIADGRLTPYKRATTTWVGRAILRPIFGAILRATRLYDQL